MEKTSLHKYFGKIKDPRINRKKKHKLLDVIVLTVIAVICGAESWDSIEEFGKSRIDFLRKILELPNGIPSHDTLNRIFSIIKPGYFEKFFIEWANSLKDKGFDCDILSIDGKTIRGSKDSYHGKSAIHLVSMWSSSNGISLGQRKVNGKTNEITAIPELLEMLDIKGSIITIDAMGTQRKIAEIIINKEANYILALKGNQGYLREDAEAVCSRSKPDSLDETIEKGHGRIETRKCEVFQNIDLLENKNDWKELKSIIRIVATREINEKRSEETRYFISSLKVDATDFNKYIRQHWGIENSLHWVLDLVFREDEQRKRNGNAAENFAIIRKIALNLLKKEDSKKMSLVTKRLKAAWDQDFLIKILTF